MGWKKFHVGNGIEELCINCVNQFRKRSYIRHVAISEVYATHPPHILIFHAGYGGRGGQDYSIKGIRDKGLCLNIWTILLI